MILSVTPVVLGILLSACSAQTQDNFSGNQNINHAETYVAERNAGQVNQMMEDHSNSEKEEITPLSDQQEFVHCFGKSFALLNGNPMTILRVDSQKFYN